MAIFKACNIACVGWCLYSNSAMHFLMPILNSFALALNQSSVLLLFLPKVFTSVMWMISLTASHLCWTVPLGGFMRRASLIQDEYRWFGWVLNHGGIDMLCAWRVGIVHPLCVCLEQTREWSVSVIGKDHAISTFLRYLHLVRIKSSWCSCFKWGCCQKTLCWALAWKYVLVMHSSWSIQNSSSHWTLSFNSLHAVPDSYAMSCSVLELSVSSLIVDHKTHLWHLVWGIVLGSKHLQSWQFH